MHNLDEAARELDEIGEKVHDADVHIRDAEEKILAWTAEWEALDIQLREAEEIRRPLAVGRSCFGRMLRYAHVRACHSNNQLTAPGYSEADW